MDAVVVVDVLPNVLQMKKVGYKAPCPKLANLWRDNLKAWKREKVSEILNGMAGLQPTGSAALIQAAKITDFLRPLSLVARSTMR